MMSTQGGYDVTNAWETEEPRKHRRIIYDTLSVILGLSILCFNFFVVLAYVKIQRLRKHISMVMLCVIIMCGIHGGIFSIIYVTRRNTIRRGNEAWCMVSTLLIEYFENYVLLLLPLVAAERLLSIFKPHLTASKVYKYLLIAFLVTTILVVPLVTWVPIIPGLFPKSKTYSILDNEFKQRVPKYNNYNSCSGRLNVKSVAPFVIRMICQIASCSFVIGSYLSMAIKFTCHHFRSTTLSSQRQLKLGKAAKTIGIVSSVFIVTTVPYGIAELNRQFLCPKLKDNVKQNLCSAMLLDLRFIFRLVYHLGSLLGPIIFTMLSPKIRQFLKTFLYSFICWRRERMGLTDTTSSSSTPAADSHSRPYNRPGQKPGDTPVVENRNFKLRSSSGYPSVGNTGQLDDQLSDTNDDMDHADIAL